MELVTLGDTKWYPVAIENIYGTPGGFEGTPEIVNAFAKCSVHYSHLAHQKVMDIATAVFEKSNQQRRYLTADENYIKVNNQPLSGLKIDLMETYQSIAVAEQIMFSLDFQENPGSPKVIIEYK